MCRTSLGDRWSEKFCDGGGRPTDATVIFSKSGAEYVCEAGTIHLSTGLTASAKGHAHEIYAAFVDQRRKDGKAAAPLTSVA